MQPALILYGSKARGDARPDSDVDLIYALEGADLLPATNARGVSVHRYPKLWLEEQARSGNLFAYHVAFEGLALEDPDGLLNRMRVAFQPKTTYEDDIEIAALVMKLLMESAWEANFEARRRFFWALRTVLISASAAGGAPIFSPTLLEVQSGVRDVADLINEREDADFVRCQAIGLKVLRRYLRHDLIDLKGETLRAHLMDRGGMARDSVRVVEENEAIAEAGLAIYG